MTMFRLPNTVEELNQRLDLLVASGIYPEDRLEWCMELINRVLEKGEKIQEEEVKRLKNDFDKYGFDDVHRFKMMLAVILYEANSFGNDPETDKTLAAYYTAITGNKVNNNSELSEAKKHLEEIGKGKIKDLAPRIKNRLALLELLTFACQKHLLPKLLEVCPLYLSCPVVAKEISMLAFGIKISKMNKKNELDSRDMLYRTDARDVLYKTDSEIKREFDLIISSLTKTPTVTRRTFEYYNIVLKYHEYKNHFKSLKKKGKFYGSPRDRAIERLQEKKLVGDDKSFDNIHAKINALVKKHEQEGSDEDVLLLGRMFEFRIKEDPAIFYDPRNWSIILDF